MALTGIMSCVCVRVPMLLAQRATFLDLRLFGNSIVMGISTLALTFVAFSGGFLNTFLGSLFLGIGTCYYFFDVLKNAQSS